MVMEMVKVLKVRIMHEPENDLDYLVRSIKEHGIVIPILVDHSMQVIDGSRRVRACERLGIEEIPAEIVCG